MTNNVMTILINWTHSEFIRRVMMFLYELEVFPQNVTVWYSWWESLPKILFSQRYLSHASALQIWGYLTQIIHPKSGSPGSPDSANYFDFPQSYSLRTRKLPNLLCWILSGRAIALKMFWFWFWIFYCSIGTPQKVRTKCIKHISRVFTTKISKYINMK